MPLSHSDSDDARPFEDLNDVIEETQKIIQPTLPPTPANGNGANGNGEAVVEGATVKWMAPPASDDAPFLPDNPAGGPILLPKLPLPPSQIAAAAVNGGKKSMKDLLIMFPDTDTPKPILANVMVVLKEDRDWKGAIAYDEFTQSVVTKRVTPWGKPRGRWSDVDDTNLANWFQQQTLLVSSPLVAEAVESTARDNPIHPVRDYLKSLKWDGIPRIEGWLSRYMGAEDKEIVREFSGRWLISAVARVMSPGCQADHTLLLEGIQGTRKSTALRTLAGDEWFTDHISDLHDKDSRMELQGKWIVELSELHAIKGKAMEAVKAFLTTRIDSFRTPWGRRSQSFPRQCVFAATTNDDQALTDETGNRRFWPVRCAEIDIPGLVEVRDQLWGEAFAGWLGGRAWWLDTPELTRLAEVEQAAHYQVGRWDDLIMDWVQNPEPASFQPGLLEMLAENPGPLLSQPYCVLISEVVEQALRGKVDPGQGRVDLMVSRCLKANGWRMHQHGGEFRGKKFWGPSKLKCPRT